MVTPRVRDNKEAWLTKCFLYLIGECPRSEAPCHRVGTGVVGKLEDGTLHTDTNQRRKVTTETQQNVNSLFGLVCLLT